MAKTREIRGRIKAVGNIQRITKTMQMIATAQFQASQRRATASQPYTRKIAELVGELASAAVGDGSFSHPLLSAPKQAANRELLLVLTSNRGLCGGFNGNILRTASNYRTSYLAENPDKQLELQVVGKKGVNFFKFTGVAVDTVHSHFGDTPSFDDVEKLAETYMADFAAGKYDAIKVVYMAFETMSRQTPTVLQLLPLKNPTAQGEGDGGSAPKAQVDYDFSPDPVQLLNELLPETVKTQLFQCFNETVVSEQIARMVAMKAATDNAAKMGKELKRIFNRARQTAITTELMEIIGGSAALD